MPAQLIWDNADPTRLTVPPQMGEPAANQLQGTPWENLCELAGRICYDSLGKGRSSDAYHDHIRETGNLSVYEHATFTISLTALVGAEHFLNRPALWARRDSFGDWRITLNLRHVLEWTGWGNEVDERVLLAIIDVGRLLAPLVVTQHIFQGPYKAHLVAPEAPEERWLSFHVHGVSRGLSHELVRHGDYTAISQRSTRYCDESDAPWIWHPLIDGLPIGTLAALNHSREQCRATYDRVVHDLAERGHDRKAARGAARGILGNALATELIFSASLAQWRRIVRLRNHPLADGEIRKLAAEIEAQLPAA